MGRRGRRRAGGADREKLTAPTSEYTDAEGNALTLRGTLTVAARREYADVRAGVGGRASASQEDLWQRGTELLFERLALTWTITGASIEDQHELLMRYRAGSPQERAWIRDVLREHCAEHFPDVQAP
jgi:hypothetical protein